MAAGAAVSPVTARTTEEALRQGKRLSRFAAPAVQAAHAARIERLRRDPAMLNAHRILARRAAQEQLGPT